tara:strand:- start:874 stop:2775 length:1902 start_codon:yes stop_codon:yes gene_type:complete
LALTKLTSVDKSVAKKLLVPVDAALAVHTADIETNTSNITTSTSNIATNTSDITAIEAVDVEQNNRLDVNEASITSLIDGQISGVVVFTTYALLDAYTPTTAQESASFKVTNDPTSSLNGYYHWVSGTAYDKDAGLANGVIESGNVDATSGGSVYTYINKTVSSYPFAKNSEYLAGTEDDIIPAIIDLYFEDAAGYVDFFLYRVKRNSLGSWEFQIRPTATPSGIYGQFVTSVSPEAGNTITTHEFTGDISGVFAINWSKLPVGFTTGNNNDINIMHISDSVQSGTVGEYFSKPMYMSFYASKNTVSNLVNQISLDKDRIFTYYNSAGLAHVDVVGIAEEGKSIALELGGDVTGITFNLTARVVSGVFDTNLLTGNSNYVYILYVSSGLIDVVYKQAVSTVARVLPAVTKTSTLSADRKEIKVLFTKSLGASASLLPNDFLVDNIGVPSSISIAGDELTLTLNRALPINQTGIFKYTNNRNLLDSDGYIIASFTDNLYQFAVNETFSVDPVGAGAPYNWIDYGTVNSRSVTAGIFTMNVAINSGIRSTDMLNLISTNDVIEIRYRCTSGNTGINWYNESNAFAPFSELPVTQNEWVIARHSFTDTGGIANNLLFTSPVNAGIFEIDYIKLIKS